MQLPDNLPSDRYLEIPEDVGTLLADDKDYEASELEDLLQYEMHKILFAIPFRVRRAHFKTSGMLVKAAREFHQE